MDSSAYSTFAALELGHTYCGYAFAKKSALVNDHMDIQTNPLIQDEEKTFSKKRMSSCLLFDAKKQYKNFGYKAENGYTNDCFLFRNFMSLLNEFEDSYFDEKKEIEMADVTGKRLPAELVITEYISALKSRSTDAMQKFGIKDEKVRWVITVPVDLQTNSKHFIRTCAVAANIPSDDLMVITEADGAFVHCYELLSKDQSTTLPNSTEYMIVNLGDCTADIRIVRKDDDLLIENPGRKKIDYEREPAVEQFLALLKGCFGNETLNNCLTNNPLFRLAMERAIEEAKYVPSKNKPVPMTNIKIALRLEDSSIDHLNDLIENNGYGKKVKLLKDEGMSFQDEDEYRKIFTHRIDQVIFKMNDVFKGCKEANRVPFIILTGDFYDCCLIKPSIRNKFPQKRIIFSKSKEEAVMKGAVLYGLLPYHNTLESVHVYEKTEDQKGLLLVINFLFEENDQKHREASDDDVLKLTSFFKSRNYEVQTWTTDKTSDKLTTDLTTFKKKYLVNKSEKYHCFVCVIMSHGDENTIETLDKKITVDELVDPFRNDTAGSFMGKPKIFMLQTCRGEEAQKMVQKANKKKKPNDKDYTLQTEQMPRDADIIKIFATAKGYASFRSRLYTTWKGAWFIHAFLCAAKQYPKKHLLEILTAVNYELAHNPDYQTGTKGECQLSVSEPALSKLFYI